jgi:hypothetical protein
VDTPDIGFMNSTLTETLVTYNDSVTIEGIPVNSLVSRGPFVLNDPPI